MNISMWTISEMQVFVMDIWLLYRMEVIDSSYLFYLSKVNLVFLVYMENSLENY